MRCPRPLIHSAAAGFTTLARHSAEGAGFRVWHADSARRESLLAIHSAAKRWFQNAGLGLQGCPEFGWTLAPESSASREARCESERESECGVKRGGRGEGGEAHPPACIHEVCDWKEVRADFAAVERHAVQLLLGRCGHGLVREAHIHVRPPRALAWHLHTRPASAISCLPRNLACSLLALGFRRLAQASACQQAPREPLFASSASLFASDWCVGRPHLHRDHGAELSDVLGQVLLDVRERLV